MTPRDLITGHTLPALIILALTLSLCPGFTSTPTAPPSPKPVPFDAQGPLDALNPATFYVSINDIAYRLAPNALFFIHPRRPISPSDINPGDTVAVILDDRRRVTVLFRMTP
ncbi:hypothetical protein JCM14469_38660 [Desulfatiferula olefinivorans]